MTLLPRNPLPAHCVTALALSLALLASAPQAADKTVSTDGLAATGPAHTGAVDLMGFQFRPVLSSTKFSTSIHSSIVGELTCSEADLPWFDATIPLPHQVDINSVALWVRDSYTTAVSATLVRSCTPSDSPTPQVTQLLQMSSNKIGQYARLEWPLPTPVQADTFNCLYQLRVSLNACNGHTALGRAQVKYSY